jgi:MYXO-CTERM domain-containing protein
VKLESWVQGDLPDFGAYAIKLGPPVAAPQASTTASAAPGPAAPAASASAAPVPAKGSGCGDCSVGASGEELPWGGLLVMAAAVSRRRSLNRQDAKVAKKR